HRGLSDSGGEGSGVRVDVPFRFDVPAGTADLDRGSRQQSWCQFPCWGLDVMTLRRLRQRAGTGLALARLIPAYVAFGLLKHVVPMASLARFAWREPTIVRDEDSQRRAVARGVRHRTL